MPHLLALDQGTSGSRSIVFDARGHVVAMAQRELRQHFPRPGWVEHDPMEIWQDQLATARAALELAGLKAADIHAVGITNQRETALLWERASGRPVHNAIVWQDRRTQDDCRALAEAGLSEAVRTRTGLVIDPYFSATKIRWLLDHVPGARAAAQRGELAFGTVDSWLLWQLTGGAHLTDVTNASRTLLWNLERGEWDEALLEAFGIPRALLPEVRPSSGGFGTVRPEWLGAALPIAGVAGDQQAALFGQACFAPGLAKNTYGTGCFLLMHTGERPQASRHGLLTTAAATGAGVPRGYALEGSVFVGGAVVQWLRDGLRAIESSAEVEALAQGVPDAGGVVFVPAFTGLGAPYWRPEARGAIVGLTRGTTVAHVARAALESIAFQSAALLRAMERDAQDSGAPPVRELRVDGGACVNELLMQFQADLLGLPVLRPHCTETTALGAARLAGLATGVYRDLDELSSLREAGRVFEPSMGRDQAEALMAGWERAVRQATAG